MPAYEEVDKNLLKNSCIFFPFGNRVFICRLRNTPVKLIRISSVFLVLFLLQSFSVVNTESKAAGAAANASHASLSESVQLYDALDLVECGLSLQAFESALTAMHGVWGKLSNYDLITIADFSKPSSSKRLFVIDLNKRQVLFQSYVAHGRNSGEDYATSFSDEMSSYQSSLGCYITGETYTGNNGYSLRLDGEEPGFNTHARERAIVMHGADYVSEAFIRDNGRLGRSFGCPAVPVALAQPIINTIKGGTCLFIYSPDKNYLSHSPLLKSAL